MEKNNSHSILPPKSEKTNRGHTRNINFFPYSFKSTDSSGQNITISQGSCQSYPHKSINASFEASPCPEEIPPTRYVNNEIIETNAILSSSFPKESNTRRTKSTAFNPTENSATTKFTLKECNSAFQTSRFYPTSRQNYSQEYNDNNYIPGFVTETEFLKQYKETNERISRLESLIWKIFNSSLPQMYEELDVKIQNSVKNNIELIEEHKDTVLNVFNNLNDEIQNFKNTLIEKQKTPKDDKILTNGFRHSGELPEVIEEESNISESEGLCRPDFSISQHSQTESMTSNQGSPSSIHRKYEIEQELKESELEESPEFYFSCHEKMITNIAKSDMSDRSITSDIFDPRETNTMPNLSQSTLMDQIDYELDGLKVNEYSSEMKEVGEEIIENIKHYSNTPCTSDKKQHQSVVIRDIVFKSLSHLNSIPFETTPTPEKQRDTLAKKPYNYIFKEMSNDKLSSKCCKSFNYDNYKTSDKRFSLNPRETSSNLIQSSSKDSNSCNDQLPINLSCKPSQIQIVKQIRNQRTRPHSFLGK